MSENREYSGFHLSSFQFEFVQKFLSANSKYPHLLIAPPGTGKTYISSVIVNEMVRSGSRRILVLVPILALLDQYKKVLEDFAQDTMFVILDRKLIREIETLDDPDTSWRSIFAIATWDGASKSEVSGFIHSTQWDLIIADISRVNVGTQRTALFKSLVNNHSESRILILADLFEGANIKRALGESYKKIDVTKLELKDLRTSSKPQRDLHSVNLKYERTKEEINFIKQYVSLSKWLSNRSHQNKIRARLASSSLYAAEESLRSLRNQAFHGDISILFPSKESEREFIKDEELLGDISSDQLGKKLSEKDLNNLLKELSLALESLDRIQIDSKFMVLRQSLANLHKAKQRTWIYASYQSTISYLHSALVTSFPDTYQVHSQMSVDKYRESLSRFEENGGILISSAALLKGIEMPVENLVLYDVPENMNLIYVILSRVVRSSSTTGLGDTVNLVTFEDLSEVLSSEKTRLRKFSNSITNLNADINDVQ